MYQMERNQVITIVDEDKEKGVYVSYPCSDDGEHDYILLRDFQRVSIMPVSIDVFDHVTCQKNSKVINFTINYDCETENDKDLKTVYLYGVIDEKMYGCVEIELQEFVDELADIIYSDRDFDSSLIFQSLKNRAIESAKHDYFMYTGNAAIGHTFDFAGMAINEKGNVLSYINSISVLNKDNFIKFLLNDCVSYVSLKELNMPRLEFLTSKAKITIEKYTIGSSKEGMIKHYEIVPTRIIVEETNEVSVVKTITITNIDSYIVKCTKYISDSKELFSRINESSSIDCLFSDLEF